MEPSGRYSFTSVQDVTDADYPLAAAPQASWSFESDGIKIVNRGPNTIRFSFDRTGAQTIDHGRLLINEVFQVDRDFFVRGGKVWLRREAAGAACTVEITVWG